jgi:pilus assembly protein TadC
MRVEQDLPLTLELMATLAEAGLSFDAALARILSSQAHSRPLASELRTFQLELLAGVPRVKSLRQLARRLEVISVTVFVSALIQAEQVGASLAETLRRQADDLRDRRKERVLQLAQGLPAKLVFPLVICFLPGIFVTTWGPMLFQLYQVANSVLRGVR